MTSQRPLDALAPSIERIAPFFREGADSPIERLAQFFQAPAGSIPPGAIQEAFSRPLGHAWDLGANAEHATDWAWELAEAGLDILLALFEGAGASDGERGTILDRGLLRPRLAAASAGTVSALFQRSLDAQCPPLHRQIP